MMEMKRAGSSILLSSHILSTIENYCDRFIVLHRGAVIAQGTLVEIAEQAKMPGASLEDIFYSLVKGGD
ncbi:ABC-type transporter ATP-binding protein EcsA [compost metagenome]